MYLGYASSLAQPSCYHGHRASTTGVDKGIIDLASARVQIRLIVAGVEVGDPDSACTIVEAVLPPSVDLLSMNRRGSRFG